MIKTGSIKRRALVLFTLAALALLLWSQCALAADEAVHWRGTYDIGMKWLNFFILAFLIVKFARSPLKRFLAGQRDAVASDIESLEREKATTLSKVNEAREMLAQGDVRFAELRERIVRQAEIEKEQIIQSAKDQSQMMLDGAKKRVEIRIEKAKAAFRAEMLDVAAGIAMERLPSLITPEDNQKMLDQFMAELSR